MCSTETSSTRRACAWPAPWRRLARPSVTIPTSRFTAPSRSLPWPWFSRSRDALPRRRTTVASRATIVVWSGRRPYRACSGLCSVSANFGCGRSDDCEMERQPSRIAKPPDFVILRRPRRAGGKFYMSASLLPGELTLVTGGSGFLGSAVVRALIARGARVRALVRPTSPRDNLCGTGLRSGGRRSHRQGIAEGLP